MKTKNDQFVHLFQSKMIGLIFGDTDFPKKILDKIKKLKIKYFIIDLSINKKFQKNKYSYSVSIGQFGKIIRLIKHKKCKKFFLQEKLISLYFHHLN